MIRIKTILHPTDFSPSADFALELAGALARDFNARLVILHVARPPVTSLGGPTPELPMGDEWSRDDLNKELHKRSFKQLSQEPEYRLSFADSESAEIVKIANRIRSDVIVVGTHGRTGLRRLLMGSVAEHVVRHASCPVLTVKLPKSKPKATTVGRQKSPKARRVVTVI